MIEIEIARQHPRWGDEDPRLEQAVRSILHEAGVRRAQISLAVVDDPTIHDLNRRFLRHDYPTDVLSFLLDREADYLEGELVVSGDTARSQAPLAGWSAADELLLYVVHGTLHLVGYDDQAPEQREAMRREESRQLARFGLRPAVAGDAQQGERS